MRYVLLLALGCLAPFSVMGSATVITVPTDYPTIQGAIDASSNGDTVLVMVGTYIENIDFKGKAITVTSDQGPGLTTINGNMAGSVVTFKTGEGKFSILEGFTIRNGRGNVWNSYTYGGGIYCYHARPIIRNNIICNNEAYWGGAISMRGCSPLVDSNIITNNIAVYGGGAINGYISSSKYINNIIAHNECLQGYGGAISLEDSHTSPFLINSVVYGNTCPGNKTKGGGIYYEDSEQPLVIINSILWNNQADEGDEIYAADDVNLSYTCVKGGIYSTYHEYGVIIDWGPGMLESDPKFADPAANDFHIHYKSPCKDTGNNLAPHLPGHDFEGDPRIFPSYGNVDMGADEDMVMVYLDPSTLSISESTGGMVTFSLAAGTDNAKRQYLLLGSMAGTSPGNKLPGGHVTLPLNWDLLTNFIIDLMNSSFFMNFYGTLDKNGTGTAIFNSGGPLPPGMAGYSFYFAYALNKPWDFVSNPVTIDIVP